MLHGYYSYYDPFSTRLDAMTLHSKNIIFLKNILFFYLYKLSFYTAII